MGANFGDIDNDGFDTGEPNLHTLVPNRMYRNQMPARDSRTSRPRVVSVTYKRVMVSPSATSIRTGIRTFMS